jgi:hypothetical protein
MPGASVDNRAPLRGARLAQELQPQRAERAKGTARAVLPRRAATPADFERPRIARRCPGRTSERTRFSSASERGRQRLQERDPRERSEQTNHAGAATNKWTRRAAARILPTRLHGDSTVASVALRLTGFTQLPQPATFARQPRFRGTVVGETSCWRICAHSVDICVEVRKVAVPEVPAPLGRGTDNSGSLLRVSGSRSDARRLRSQQ